MERYRRYFSDILFLLGSDSYKIPILFLLFLSASLLEAIGLGLLGFYLSVLLGNEIFFSSSLTSALGFLGLGGDKTTRLLFVGFVVLLMVVTKASLTVFVHWQILRFSWRQNGNLRTRLLNTYQQYDYSHFLARNSAEYIQAIQLHTQNFTNTLITTLRLIGELVVAAGIVSLLIYTSGVLILILGMSLISFVFLYDGVFRRTTLQLGRSANESNAKAIRTIQEAMRGFKEIRVLGREEFFLESLRSLSAIFGQSTALSQLRAATPRHILEIVLVSFFVAVSSFTLLHGENIEELLPTFAIFAMAAMRLTPITNLLAGGLSQLQFDRDGIGKLSRDLRQSHRSTAGVEYMTSSSPMDVNFESLILESVGFTYPNEKTSILQDVNFHISSGEIIGLSGVSGSGKTTLINLMLGLLPPTNGIIRLNSCGRTDEALGIQGFAAYIPQDFLLLDDTIVRNITLQTTASAVDLERVEEVVARCQLSTLVSNLDHGLNTLIGEAGARISGGERQRIAVARAIFHNRELIIMDEATNALDAGTEKYVLDNISTALENCTFLIVSHRPETLKRCDRILYIREHSVFEG
jgi:ATP-binding cassette, subfamily B, bacterial PglK